MPVVIGIDFGTCFSSVYFIHGGQYVPLVPNGEKPMIPTVFFHDSIKGSLAGKPALRAGKNCPSALAEYVKRHYRESSIKLKNKKNEVFTFSPEDIVRHIVNYLIEGARGCLQSQYQLDNPELSAVLTVPVTYGEEWKKMLLSALKDAGVTVHAVIQEPVAAAVCFLEEHAAAGGTVLVYDLGGGTTDVTLLQKTGSDQQPYAVLAQGGDVIGGNDWDDRLLTLLERQIVTQLSGLSDAETDRFLETNRRRLTALAREIKEILSEESVYDMPCEMQGNLYDIRVTRQEFESCTASLLGRTMQTVRNVVQGQSPFREVILVGGGSHMPQVKTRIQQEFPDCQIRIANPEFAVAMGAARYAAISAPVPVLLQSAHSYGIILEQGQTRSIRNLIFKNASLPASGRYECRLSGQFLQFAVQEGDDTDQTLVPLQHGGYALSATVWFSRPPEPGTVCIAELELTSSGLLKLTVLDQNGNEISGTSVSLS